MRSAVDPRISVVVLTHNRRDELLGTLARLTALPARRPIIVVDNDSSDGTREAIVRRFPEVALLHAGGNLGAAGRNLGIHAARTPYVALADDDTWWTEPALRRGAELLDAHARLAVVTAQVLVGVDAHADPACAVMATARVPMKSPIRRGARVIVCLPFHREELRLEKHRLPAGWAGSNN